MKKKKGKHRGKIRNGKERKNRTWARGEKRTIEMDNSVEKKKEIEEKGR